LVVDSSIQSDLISTEDANTDEAGHAFQ
jgi:hypothetical protein